jgi:hypothetical protein
MDVLGMQERSGRAVMEDVTAAICIVEVFDKK